MTDSIKIDITTGDEPIRVNSRLESWAASYTPSEPLRKAIIKRTLLIAAFDERLIDKSINDADLRKLMHQVAQEMLEEPPLPLVDSEDDQATTPAE